MMQPRRQSLQRQWPKPSAVVVRNLPKKGSDTTRSFSVGKSLMQITENKVVQIEYVLTDNDGEVRDSSQGMAPVSYVHGVDAILPVLEKALEGQTVGEQLQITVSPSQGYGERNEDLVKVVPRSRFEGVEDLAEGMQFRVKTEDGPLIITVVKIADQMVTVDANHELAGVTLNFDITIGAVRDATPAEISQRRPEQHP